MAKWMDYSLGAGASIERFSGGDSESDGRADGFERINSVAAGSVGCRRISHGSLNFSNSPLRYKAATHPASTASRSSKHHLALTPDRP